MVIWNKINAKKIQKKNQNILHDATLSAMGSAQGREDYNYWGFIMQQRERQDRGRDK